MQGTRKIGNLFLGGMVVMPIGMTRRFSRRRLDAPERTVSSRTSSRCGPLYRQRRAQAKRGLLLMAQKMLFMQLQHRARDRDAVLIVSLHAPRRAGVIQRVLSALLELDPRRLAAAL
jgi:hypothetical protein